MAKSLYIHVPFCDHICAYCDFERCRSHPYLMEEWLKVTIDKINELDEQLTTIYIGGGTPSALSCDQLESLLSSLDRFQPIEFTMEANIENLTKEKIALLVKHQVNRISLGVQTLNDELLNIIHRHHTKEDIFSKIKEMDEAGIHDISVDMMYGLPSQTLEVWLMDLDEITSCKQVTHVSIYSLTIEENSYFGRHGFQKAKDELEEDMYFNAIEHLEKKGFHQYEISNFSKDQHESLHNITYWNYEDFIGIGCGAYGKENHIYYHSPFRLDLYIQNKLEREEIFLSQQDEMFEMVMMGLRMKKGISLQRFKELFNCELWDVYRITLQKHMPSLLKIEDDHLKCTEKGFALVNTILIDFMEENEKSLSMK